MDENGFGKFLRKKGKKEHVIQGLIHQVRQLETYFEQTRHKDLDRAEQSDLDAYIKSLDQKYPDKSRVMLRGIALYYQFANRPDLAGMLFAAREEEIEKKRTYFRLREFRRVDPEHIRKLETVGIVNVNDMLLSGRTVQQRQELARQTGLPLEKIVELVKLSDLTRLGGVKAIRARLYFDAGVDCLETMAQWNPEEMRQMLVEFVRRTGFEGIAPLPKEARNSVEAARKLPKLVEF